MPWCLSKNSPKRHASAGEAGDSSSTTSASPASASSSTIRASCGSSGSSSSSSSRSSGSLSGPSPGSGSAAGSATGTARDLPGRPAAACAWRHCRMTWWLGYMMLHVIFPCRASESTIWRQTQNGSHSHSPKMKRKQSQLLLMTHDSMHNQLIRGINHLSFAMFNHLQVLPALLLPVFLLACSSSAPCPRFLGEKSNEIDMSSTSQFVFCTYFSDDCSPQCSHHAQVPLDSCFSFLKSKTEFLALF